MISINCLDKLTGQQVYDIFFLRQNVFMLEQNCLYQDIDVEDATALHLCCYDDKGALLGYLRILPPGREPEPAIGRVAVKKKARRGGIARRMMEVALEKCQELYPDKKIRLSAQTYLIDFYASLGFMEIGPEYLEDDIPHQDMISVPLVPEK
ncbi:MAG: GNAT family N-acetyltransferase [Pseudomonadales bacterium]